jgi:large subunit ribosomal protein L15
MQLNQIGDNKGAKRPKKRVGRGIGSGLGKTAGRGHKGQKSRSGVAIKGFEGGQMPLYRRLPKRGFNNISRKIYRVVNIGQLQNAVDAGRLDAKKPVDAAAIIAAGLVKNPRDGIRLLAKGELKAKLTISVAGASKTAIAAVEKAGGTVALTAAASPSGAESADQGAADKSAPDESAAEE